MCSLLNVLELNTYIRMFASVCLPTCFNFRAVEQILMKSDIKDTYKILCMVILIPVKINIIEVCFCWI